MTSAFVEPASGSTDLRYDGAYVPGSYTDGDIVVYGGIAYMAQRPTTNPPTPWPVAGIAPNIVTGMVPIFDIVLSAPQTVIDIPNIPQIYSHLKLVGSGRSSAAATNDQWLLRFNNDSGGNYGYQFMRGAGSSATATENVSSPTFGYFGQPAGANAPANVFDISVLDILDYTSTVKHKSAIGQFGLRGGDTTGQYQFGNVVNFWKSLAAINEIQIYTSTGQLVAGTRVTLYGILSSPTILPQFPPITAPVPATTLPSSPTDQQQAILVDNTTTPTYSWLFQWSAAAAKWLFVGGTPLGSENTASSTLANQAAYVVLPNGAATITLPRTGRYDVVFGADGSMGSQAIQVAPKYGSATPVDTDSITSTQSSGGYVTMGRSLYNRPGNAGDVWTLWYKGPSASGWVVAKTHIGVVPVWVT